MIKIFIKLTILFYLLQEAIQEPVTLTQETILDFIENNSNNFIFFYATPLARVVSKKLEEFSRLEKTISESELPFQIALGKMDSTNSNEFIKDKLKIEKAKIPNIYLITKEKSLEYNGGATSDAMLTWLKRNLKQESLYSKQVDSSEELIPYFESNKHLSILVLPEAGKHLLKNYSDYCRIEDRTTCLHSFTLNEIAGNQIEEYHAAIYVKNVHEKDPEFQSAFLNVNTHLPTSFNEITATIRENIGVALKIFERGTAHDLHTSEKPALVLFVESTTLPPHMFAYEELRSIARKIKKDVDVYYTQSISEIDLRMYEIEDGIKATDIPIILLLNRKENKRYRMPNPISGPQIYEFVQKYKKNLLKPAFKSAEVPMQNDGPVFELVRHTFNHTVYENNKDVFVYFYNPSPPCRDCDELHPIFEDLALRFSKNTNLIFARINVRENEVEAHEGKSPRAVFRLFAHKKKDNPIEIKDIRNFEELVAQLKPKLGNKWVEPLDKVDNILRNENEL